MLLGDDLHAHLRGDVAVHLHGHLQLAQRLDRIGQLDLALVDLEPLASSACAMSAEVTEPYIVLLSPTRRAISISSCSSRWP